MRVTLSPDTVRGLAALTDAVVLEGDKDAQVELVADLAVMLGCACAEGFESEDEAHDAIRRSLWSQWGVRA